MHGEPIDGPRPAADDLGIIMEKFGLGDSDAREDLDEIRMLFEAVAAWQSEGYTRITRDADGSDERLVGLVKPADEEVEVYRTTDDPDGRLTGRDKARTVPLPGLVREDAD